jgi:hypothetical protein
MNFRDKRKIFEEFYKKSKPWFRFFHSRDKSIQHISDYYGFHICPGSRDGGCDKRIIEVFWGDRPFDKTLKIDGFKVSDEFLSENGATLHYQLLDSGNVVISLAPAKTKHLGPIEDHIFISMLKNPKKLLKLNYVKRHWSYVKAYMNITSLEGNKNIKNIVITWYLRYFKNTIIDKRQNGPKIYTAIRGVLKFVATVGLSGFLVILIMSLRECKKEDKNYNSNIEIIENLNQVKSNQVDLLMELKDINRKIDENDYKLDNVDKIEIPQR